MNNVLEYLNREVYPFLSTKQLKIVKGSFTTGLLVEVEKYSKAETEKRIKVERERNRSEIRSLEGIIDRLKRGVESGKEWRKGHFGKK